MQYGPPPFLLNDNELLPFEHACMLREEHYSHPENLDSWESIMPTLWRFEVRWSIFGLSPLLPDHSDPQTLAEDFKTFFTDKVDNIRDKIKKARVHDGLVDREDDSLLIPTSTETTDDDESLLMTEDAELYDCLPSEDQEDVQSRCFVEFQCLSEEELYKTLKTMSKKFCSLDPIPVWLQYEMF